MATPLQANQLALAPLGAGDLIDRAVRLYRRHFWTLIRIAAPPVLVSTVGALLVTVGSYSAAVELRRGDVGLTLLLFVVNLMLNVIVMGGAARNLITHLLWNEPFSAGATYRNVRARFGSLLGASVIVAFWLFLAMFLALFAWALAIQIFLIGGYAAVGIHNSWIAYAAVIIWVLAMSFLALLLFFLMVKFIVYVPQVLMVEGRGVFDSVGRSFTLAKGNLRRLMAMSLFHWVAAYSAWTILIIPLVVYGWVQGVQISPNRALTWPMWYAVGYNVVTQASAILLSPVSMLGLSLMYVDERVRQEGYDIELLAARQLAPMPSVYAPSVAVAATAAAAAGPATASPRPQYNSPGSPLGLR
jgi:hypothetical protein